MAVEIPGQHQRQRDFHQFRRLDAGDPKVQPAPRAVDDVAKQGDADQQREAQCKYRQREALQVMRRNVGEQPHHAQRHQHVAELP